MDDTKPSVKNLFKPHGIATLVEFGMAMTVLIITRVGGDGNDPVTIGEGDNDEQAFGYLVAYGYFFITCVNVVTITIGEPINLKDLIYGFVGGVFYIALGAIMLDAPRHDSTQTALGVIAILTGIVFLIDLGLMILQAKKERN